MIASSSCHPHLGKSCHVDRQYQRFHWIGERPASRPPATIGAKYIPESVCTTSDDICRYGTFDQGAAGCCGPHFGATAPAGCPAGVPRLPTVPFQGAGTAAIPQCRLGAPRTALGIAVLPPQSARPRLSYLRCPATMSGRCLCLKHRSGRHFLQRGRRTRRPGRSAPLRPAAHPASRSAVPAPRRREPQVPAVHAGPLPCTGRNPERPVAPPTRRPSASRCLRGRCGRPSPSLRSARSPRPAGLSSASQNLVIFCASSASYSLTSSNKKARCLIRGPGFAGGKGDDLSVALPTGIPAAFLFDAHVPANAVRQTRSYGQAPVAIAWTALRRSFGRSCSCGRSPPFRSGPGAPRARVPFQHVLVGRRKRKKVTS